MQRIPCAAQDAFPCFAPPASTTSQRGMALAKAAAAAGRMAATRVPAARLLCTVPVTSTSFEKMATGAAFHGQHVSLTVALLPFPIADKRYAAENPVPEAVLAGMADDKDHSPGFSIKGKALEGRPAYLDFQVRGSISAAPAWLCLTLHPSSRRLPHPWTPVCWKP